MARTTGKAIAIYKGGIHGLIEYAVREDGQMFARYQDRGPYGYRWGSWREKEKIDVAALPASIESGFSLLHRAHDAKVDRLRLPAAAETVAA